MPTAFVTGSTGLLGSNLVRALVADGYTVKALARNAQKAQRILRDVDCDIIIGDMENVAGFAPELAGCDVLFHTAAYFREYYGMGDHWQTLKRINVDATIELLDAAEQHGVQKVIHTSSSGVIGLTADGSPADESTLPDDQLMKNLYFKSKWECEKAIQHWLKSHDLPVVLILPTAIYGPGDDAPTGGGEILLSFFDGSLPAIPPGGFYVVDVRDVARSMINAVQRGKSGERYILTEGYYSIEEVFQKLHSLRPSHPMPNMKLPAAIALPVAHLSEFVARLTNSEPQVPVNGVRTLLMKRPVVATKAQRELNVTFRPFDETLEAAVAWYEADGRIQTPALA